MHTVEIPLPPAKRWQPNIFDQSAAQELSEALQGKPLLSQLLFQRGITTYDQARDYFNPTAENLIDPFLMKDMQQAVDRILLAIQRQEKY